MTDTQDTVAEAAEFDAGTQAAEAAENPAPVEVVESPAANAPGDDLTGTIQDTELDDMLAKLSRGESLVPDESAEAEGTVEPVDEEPTQETEQAEDATEDTETAEAVPALPTRIRLPKNASAKDKALLVAAGDLMREKGLSFEDAVKELGITAPAATQEPKKEEAPAKQPAIVGNVTLEAAQTELEAAEAAEAEAEATYDAAQIRDARKRVREAAQKVSVIQAKIEILAEQQQRTAQTEADQKAKAEWQQATGHIPDFAPGSALYAEAKALFESLPDSFFEKPDPSGRIARMVWASQNPNKPFPANAAARPQVSRPPAKPGVPVRALSTGTGVSAPSLPSDPSKMTSEQIDSLLFAASRKLSGR